jgi:hypothetical protein
MDIYQKIKAGKETVALRLFTLPEEYGTGTTIHADVVYVKDSNVNFVKSMGFYNNYFDEKHQYQGLSVVALSHADCPTPSGYEVHVEHRTSKAITLDKAASMLSVLKPINRKMTKLEVKLGHHEDFAEYVCRLATVLKAKSFYHKSTSSLNDMTEYRVDDITQLKQAIEQMISFNVKITEAA